MPGDGHGAKLHSKREAAIVALLQTGSIEEAAEQTGVSVSTLSRWMKREEFQTRYRAARQRTFEAGLSRLQALISHAITTLKRNLDCGRPMAEIRAASAILTHATAGAELLDVLDRLTDLERKVTP